MRRVVGELLLKGAHTWQRELGDPKSKVKCKVYRINDTEDYSQVKRVYWPTCWSKVRTGGMLSLGSSVPGTMGLTGWLTPLHCELQSWYMVVLFTQESWIFFFVLLFWFSENFNSFLALYLTQHKDLNPQARPDLMVLGESTKEAGRRR